MRKLNFTILTILFFSLLSYADIPPKFKQKTDEKKTLERIDHVFFYKKVGNPTLVYSGEEYTIYPFKDFIVEDGYHVRVDADHDPVGLNCSIIEFSDSTITVKMGLLGEGQARFSYFFDVIDANGEEVDYPSPFFTRQTVSFVNFQPRSDTLDANNIRAVIYAKGNQFFNEDHPELESPHSDSKNIHYNYPKGKPKSPICTMSPWVAGLDESDNIHLSAIMYYDNEPFKYFSGPCSKEDDDLFIDDTDIYNWTKTWKITTEAIQYHKTHYNDNDYQMPEAIASWPAHGNPDLGQRQYIAPFIDVDNDGVYHPEKGDFPKIKGDQMIFYVQNDITSARSFGLEIDTKSYAFAKDENQDEVLANTTLYQYVFHNRSNREYHDVYLGLWVDFDLGFSEDDYIGCDVENGYMYVYNAASIDGGVEGSDNDLLPPFFYGGEIPAQAAMILGGPKMDVDQTDNPSGGCDYSITGINFGNGIIDDERLGMSRFISYFNTPSGTNIPQKDEDYYNHLRGFWEDDKPIQYGEYINQTDVVGPEARFMYPGDSDPMNWGTNCNLPNGGYNQNGKYWTEETVDNPHGDRSGLISIGPFTFEPGSVDTLDFALVTAPAKSNTQETLSTLKSYCKTLKSYYVMNPSHFGDNIDGIADYKKENNTLNVYPNPVESDYLYVQLPKEVKEGTYAIYSISGTLIYKNVIGQNENINHVYVGNLSKGVYLISFTTKDNQLLQAKFVK